MTPKMAAERKALRAYGCWDGREPTQHRLGQDEILRARALAAERLQLDLTGQLMGDPSPRRSALALRDAAEHLAYVAEALESHRRED